MSNRNWFLVGSVTLAIWVSGVIAPDAFVRAGQPAKPSSAENVVVTNTTSNPVPVTIQSGSTQSRTLVEIISPTVSTTSQVVYTVPAGHRLVITDVLATTDNNQGIRGQIYRDAVEVSRFGLSQLNYEHSYQSGIEFDAGHTVGVAIISGLVGVTVFFELRGYLEAQ